MMSWILFKQETRRDPRRRLGVRGMLAIKAIIESRCIASDRIRNEPHQACRLNCEDIRAKKCHLSSKSDIVDM